jgi:hypothetical protein
METRNHTFRLPVKDILPDRTLKNRTTKATYLEIKHTISENYYHSSFFLIPFLNRLQSTYQIIKGTCTIAKIEYFNAVSFLVVGERLPKYIAFAIVLLIIARIIAEVKICIVPSDP